jgi:two-component system cell cycle response regulator
MPDTGRLAAQRTAERLCQIMSENPIVLPNGERLTVTLSIGVATSSKQDETAPQELIECADKALYAAKEKGRNTVVMAKPTTPSPAPKSPARRTHPRATQQDLFAWPNSGMV